MNGQQHVIKQQIVEITLDREEDAYSLQTEISRIYRTRIIPLIDEIFTQYSPSDKLYRIDSLVLDVGHINLTNLESELVAKITTLLSGELAHSFLTETTDEHFELIVYFARTGTLPWWASGTLILTESLRRLLPTNRLRPVLLTITQSVIATHRFVRHFNDEILASVCESLLPNVKFKRWVSIFDQKLRHYFWGNLLRRILNPRITSLEIVYFDVLRQTAADAGIALSELLKRVLQSEIKRDHTTFISDAEASDPLTQILNLVYLTGTEREDPTLILATEVQDLRTQLLNLIHLALQMVKNGELFPISAARVPNLAALLARLPDDLHTQMLRTLSLRLETVDSETSFTLSTDTLEELQIIVTTLPRDQIETVLEIIGLSILRQEFSNQTFLVKPSLIEYANQDESFDLQFSDSNAAYIENAGLVILWPFLTQFFTNLDLVVDKQFKDEQSRHRAVGLLHILTTGQINHPEFLLPLNKVLCGMPIETLFDFGDQPTDVEIEACETLLGAVIARAPILREMSEMGLRGTFLLRKGVLSAEAGGWLLRVERETYDVVLDQFPWRWDWLRLPWMDVPLRVEW